MTEVSEKFRLLVDQGRGSNEKGRDRHFDRFGHSFRVRALQCGTLVRSDVAFQVQASRLEWRHIRPSQSRVRSENTTPTDGASTTGKETPSQEKPPQSSQLY